MNAQHTPGPWWVTDYGVRDSGGYICATTKPSRYEGQDERFAQETAQRAADAHLIAASPDMFAALHEYREAYAGVFLAEMSLPHARPAALARLRAADERAQATLTAIVRAAGSPT